MTAARKNSDFRNSIGNFVYLEGKLISFEGGPCVFLNCRKVNKLATVTGVTKNFFLNKTMFGKLIYNKAEVPEILFNDKIPACDYHFEPAQVESYLQRGSFSEDQSFEKTVLCFLGALYLKVRLAYTLLYRQPCVVKPDFLFLPGQESFYSKTMILHTRFAHLLIETDTNTPPSLEFANVAEKKEEVDNCTSPDPLEFVVVAEEEEKDTSPAVSLEVVSLHSSEVEEKLVQGPHLPLFVSRKRKRHMSLPANCGGDSQAAPPPFKSRKISSFQMKQILEQTLKEQVEYLKICLF